jgi:hypothetical protein
MNGERIEISAAEVAALEASRAPTMGQLATTARAERDQRIAAIMWRVQRYESEVRQALTPTDDIVALDAYVQALRDVPQQVGFPGAVTWPEVPE